MLIADDDVVWVKVVTRYFTGLKYTVFSSSTWAGARALADQHLPQVILLDGSLEDGTSADFCASIRANPRLNKTALIVVSGDELEAAVCKADSFVLKGGSLGEVEDAIAEVQKRRA
jgi:CheY-like chemotaxis protein